MGAKIIIRGLSLGVLALLLNVAVAFAWVLFYSVALAPGHDGAFYQAYGQRVAPWSAVVAGTPILFGAGWLAARGPRPDQAALIPAAAYMLLDLMLISIGGVWPPPWTLAASYLTKFAASYAGGRLAPRQKLLQ